MKNLSLFWQAFLLQVIIRLALILSFPHNYAFDGFQRWAGRDHLLIRDWLPATQSLIVLCNQLGLGIAATKFILSLLGAAAVGSGSVIAAHLFGRQSGRLFMAIGCFAPFLAWTSTMYQEGTFLCLAVGAIALVLKHPKRLWLADLVAGAVALCRYEGWPFVILYCIWRKDRRAILGLWGMALWLSIKALGVEGHQPSPISYADWEGLGSRFSWSEYGTDIWSYLKKASNNGALWVWIGALFGIKKAFLKDKWLTVLLLLLIASQFAAVLGWIAGLETAILRMLLIPTFLLGIFCVGAGKDSHWRVAIAIGFGLFWLNFSHYHINKDSRYFSYERKLAAKIEDCEDCLVMVKPRKGLGTRDRHDGCEILMGVSDLRLHEDFICSIWDTLETQQKATHIASWNPKKKRYSFRELK